MLEALLIGMIFMILSSSMYGYAGMENRYIKNKIHEDEAYYAAVTAVRMMVQEIMDHEAVKGSAAYQLTYGTGMKKRTVNLIFEAEDSDVMGEVDIPVDVWSEVEDDLLYLAAEVHVGEAKSTVRVQMRKEKEFDSMTGEPPEATEKVRWVPVVYETGGSHVQ